MLETLFYPKTIAVVGASNDPHKVGYAILNNIKKFGYQGEIIPVNPKSDEILGLKTSKSILDMQKDADLAVIAIPAAMVPGAIRDCVAKGIKSAVIISAGFKEAGASGIMLEEELKAIAREGKIRLLGPNCLGIINTVHNLNATFAAGMLPKGRLAFFSQSGALGIAILDWAIGNRIGFSKFISLGNKADLNETDFIEYFIKDDETDIILGYIEDVVDGRRFLEIAKKASRIKPIILVKSGGTQAGARAASSHTGALAGSENAFTAAFRQTGVIRAEGIEDLFETAKAFNSKKLPEGNNLLIVTNAGGPGIIAADTAEKLSINLPTLSKETIQTLSALLPKNASLYNPVDIIGDAPAERYAAVFEHALNDPNIDGFLVILTPQATINAEDAAKAVISSAQK
ncbi:MAG: CoA-binding protein, partial [Nitrospirae bacterium]|nr:CoA-binding protein [Nitrospirota bacterium]